MTFLSRAARSIFAGLLLASISAAAFADGAEPLCVTPSSEVTTSVSIRQSPSASSAMLGRLLPGNQLPLVGEVPNWYLVQLTDGTNGNVSKRWTDAVACATNAPVPIHGGGVAYELDAIDVGTGLSVFIRGPDFTLLYDAGSNDDLARGSKNRTAAYLASVLPDVHKIDHIVLSHPHRDHVELLADIVREHGAGDVWDSGAYNDICGYRDFLRAIADAQGVRYHNANTAAGTETVSLGAKTCYGTPEPDSQIVLNHGDRIDTTPTALGATARMQFLHIDGSHQSNINDNSLVLRVELGSHSVLLMGDAEAGGRADPSTTPTPTSVEGKLLACCKDQLRADVLVVGHHGSKSSSRKALLDAIGAHMFLVSAGPTKYATVVLPDQAVIDELSTRGTVMRTDVDDTACKTSDSKVGEKHDGAAGGCNNIQVTFDDAGVRAKYYP